MKNNNIYLEIWLDGADYNPRNWSNPTIMYCFSRKYNLGDEHNYNREYFNSWEDFKKQLMKDHDILMIKPIYLYDHSGITIKTTPFACRWDSGQVGYVFITKDSLKSAYGDNVKLTDEDLTNLIESDVYEYDHYIRGEVYGYSIIKKVKCECCGSEKEDIIDSCGGFIGEIDDVIECMKDSVSEEYEHLFDIDNIKEIKYF